MKKTATAIATVVLVLFFSTNVTTEENVSLKVSPEIYVGGKKGGTPINVIIRITPHPDNRKINMEWESDSGNYGSSEMDLDGEDAPRIIDARSGSGFGRGVVFYDGNYTVRVTLTRSNNQKVRAVQTIKDMSRATNEEGR